MEATTWTKGTLPALTGALALGSAEAIASGEQARIWDRVDAFLTARANRTGHEQRFVSASGTTLALVLPGERPRSIVAREHIARRDGIALAAVR